MAATRPRGYGDESTPVGITSFLRATWFRTSLEWKSIGSVFKQHQLEMNVQDGTCMYSSWGLDNEIGQKNSGTMTL